MLSVSRVVAQYLHAYHIANQFAWLKLESGRWIAISLTPDVSSGLNIIVLTLFAWFDPPHRMGEVRKTPPRVNFGRRFKPECHGSGLSSNAGWLA